MFGIKSDIANFDCYLAEVELNINLVFIMIHFFYSICLHDIRCATPIQDKESHSLSKTSVTLMTIF